MKIASNYQKLLEAGLTAAKAMEPVTFAGMFDSGVDYLFSLSIPLFEAELGKCTPIFVDLSGLTTKEEIESELRFTISDRIFEISANAGYDEITKAIRNASKSQPVLLVIYLGQDGTTDKSLFQFLNRARNYLGWRFSYCIFTSTRIFRHYDGDPLVEKILKRHVLPVLPLSDKDALVVLQNYEERYGKKVPSHIAGNIMKASGGNPGLIKAIYLQVMSGDAWKEPDVLEEQLYFRLKGILEDAAQGALATRYGYEGIQPLLQKFEKVYQTLGPRMPEASQVDPLLLHFSKSQRKVVEYLKAHVGTLITKDDIAKLLWGNDWSERYSDWAIDQLISTLREKLVNIDKKAKIISKRGEGIIYTT